MWIWKSDKGELWKDGKLVSKGYSGAPGFKNDPVVEGIRNKGPIPRGMWKLGKVIVKHPKLGGNVIPLTPVGHKALGRSAFLIHADSIKAPGTASQGCIILPAPVRAVMAASQDRELLVTSGDDL